MLVERPELRQVPVGLLEVVAEDLLVLQRAVAVDDVRPADELLVQLGARPLQQRLVGRVADERVVEPPRLLEAPLGRLRPHELLVSERLQVNDDPLTDRLGRELAHCVGGEDVPDDRGRLDDRALLGSEPVDSRGKQRLDGRRDRHDREVAACVPAPVDELQPLLLDQHGEQLLDEQGIALGGCDHARAHVVVEPGVAEQVVDHALAVTRTERLEHDVRRVRRVRPLGPELEQVGTRVAENEHRCVLDGLPDVLDEIEERRFRPVEVLEHDDERPLARELLEELAGRPEELLHRKLLRREPDHALSPQHIKCIYRYEIVSRNGMLCLDGRKRLQTAID